MKKLFPLAIAYFLCLSACVPARLYDEIKAKKADCDTENTTLKAENLHLTTSNNDLKAQLAELQAKVTQLESDTTDAGNNLRSLQNQYQSIYNNYNDLVKDGPNSAANSEANKKLIRDLQKTKEELQRREDEIIIKERLLKEKKEHLEKATAELKEKDARLIELERILAAKDSAVNALRVNVEKALKGFTDKGLSIETKNGKVYVLLEERLLFATGSILVDPKGKEALKELAKVLEKNSDINVLIEGHTDNVPMHGAGEIKDNWDLSVMRSTSVVKILLSSAKINASRLTAAGRGEFSPIDKNDNAVGRAKNRRIEVILTPKLDELLKVLETN